MNTMKDKYIFWIRELNDWSRIDDNGYKYEYSVIQNQKEGIETPLDNKYRDALIALVFWVQPKNGDVISFTEEEMKAAQNNKELYDDNSNRAIKTSEFSISY